MVFQGAEHCYLRVRRVGKYSILSSMYPHGLPGVLRFSLLTLCVKGVTVWSRRRIGFVGGGTVTGIAAVLVALWATAAPAAPATAATAALATAARAAAKAKVAVMVQDAA